jgi:hypothetical protein
MLRVILGFLKPEGRYSHEQHMVASTASYLFLILLLYLVKYHVVPGYFMMLGGILYLYVDYVITGKRLRGLGRPNSDYYKGFIPFWVWFFKEEDTEEERNKEGFKQALRA